MSKRNNSISARFRRGMTEKNTLLQELREIARLTDPTLLLRENVQPDDPTAQNYQSDGARLLGGLTGRVLSAVLPPGETFARTLISARSAQSESMTDDLLAETEARLFAQDIQTLGALESAGGIGGNDSVLGLHAQARNIYEQVIALGDVLIRQDADFGLTSFAPDDYTVLRNNRGEVLYYTCREGIDLLSLFAKNDQDRNYMTGPLMKMLRVKTEDELNRLSVDDRQGFLFTSYEFQPITKEWILRQEVSRGNDGGGLPVYESSDKVPSHWSIFWKLSKKNNYGTGLGYLNRGDLKMYDNLCHRLDEFAVSASKHLWVHDTTDTTFNPESLNQPSGSVITADVSGGEVQNVACLSPNKQGDFSVVMAHAANVRQNLGRAFLEAEARQSERTTAYEVSKTTIEGLQSALGAVYPNIADGFQRPLWAHTRDMLVRKKLMTALPSDSIQTEYVTGLAALARQSKFQSVLAFQQFLATLGVPLDQVLNLDRYIDVAARYIGVTDRQIIKSPAERKKAIQEALQLKAQSEAVTTGIQTAGRIAEQKAAAQTAG
jgi:hypothetical protein